MANVITGTPSDDSLRGTSSDDIIYGLGGNDHIGLASSNDVQGGNDTAYGGGGIDVVSNLSFRLSTRPVNFTLNPHKTVVETDSGTKTLISIEGIHADGSDYGDHIKSGPGDDWIWGYGGDDVIETGPGNDRISGFDGDDTLRGGTGDDNLVDGSFTDLGTGNDALNGGPGNDHLRSGDGDDLLIGGAGIDTVTIGFQSAVNFTMSSHRMVVDTSYGIKTLKGIEAVEIIASPFDDVIVGGSYDDIIYGLEGNDTLIGGGRNDLIYAGDGDDLIKGGEGDDSMFGEVGQDTFVFGPDSGQDTIGDFELGTDRFQLDDGQTISAVQAQGGDTQVLFGDGSSVLLQGVAVSDPLALFP